MELQRLLHEERAAIEGELSKRWAHPGESLPSLGEQWKCATDLQRSIQTSRSQRVQSLDFIFNEIARDFEEVIMRN
jgi:hypothetical protein